MVIVPCFSRKSSIFAEVNAVEVYRLYIFKSHNKTTVYENS